MRKFASTKRKKVSPVPDVTVQSKHPVSTMKYFEQVFKHLISKVETLKKRCEKSFINFEDVNFFRFIYIYITTIRGNINSAKRQFNGTSSR